MDQTLGQEIRLEAMEARMVTSDLHFGAHQMLFGAAGLVHSRRAQDPLALRSLACGVSTGACAAVFSSM